MEILKPLKTQKTVYLNFRGSVIINNKVSKPLTVKSFLLMSDSGPVAPTPAPRYTIDVNTEMILAGVSGKIAMVDNRVEIFTGLITREFAAMEQSLNTRVDDR